jgi:UDP-N-acetylglucosamine 2-epimerase (non-hydrolysing)
MDRIGDHAKRVLVVVGTRPEAIKMAPVVQNLTGCEGLELRLCVTAQHRSMLDEVLRVFEMKPDYDLDIMRPGQTVSGVASTVLRELDPILEEWRPDWLLVQGDTTTTMAASLAAFHRRISVGHVEAGLRTHDLMNPWPEEANRRITSIVTRRHYCPTERARLSLLAEGVSDSNILVTGNPVVDALQMAVAALDRLPRMKDDLSRRFNGVGDNKRMILVTGHRRESFGEGFQQICRALAKLGEREDVQIVYPVHLNPNVQEPVFATLGDRARIKLIEPLDYLTFVWLMQRCFFILTDSGGVQEEAPALGKPVLVMRETTERPEAIDAGSARLVGTKADKIVAECEMLLDQPHHHKAMASVRNPFGDGQAGHRIARDLMNECRN